MAMVNQDRLKRIEDAIRAELAADSEMLEDHIDLLAAVKAYCERGIDEITSMLAHERGG